MRRRMRSVCAIAIAMAAAVTLITGVAGPAAAGSASATTGTGTGARPEQQHRVTLITGDRVVVDAKGRVTSLERAKGREKVPLRVYKLDGRTMVVPADAHPLIATGKLDQRLFDIAELDEAARREDRKQGLKLIVGYRGSATAAKEEVRDADGTQVHGTLKALNADVVSTPQQGARDLWNAVTDQARSGPRTLVAGIAHVWLDGVREASLDRSVPQIGAPTAWAAGYDGKGVKVAVLDTGVDATHPDLKDQVIGEKNFSSSADAKDRVGHGTHVASTVAGTGAKSSGKYKGVAPGAKLLNGKVLGDDGTGDDSGVLAGMEWAAAQGADVVNLSLGGSDTPGIDPLEAMVNKLSAEKNMLFAIAAGNSGPAAGTVGSPGSADAALTVGAVDDKDELADFSSRGPRVGDGAVKPDVTAPGVDITAASAAGSLIAKEYGEKPAGYTTISGTSMATPHVAGAAALLKQAHPDWGHDELKGALAGSAKAGAFTPFQQGAGRIVVDKALRQAVIAEPTSVHFGVQQWPHTDDKPVAKQITYRNLGTKDVTLDLAATATDPKGQKAPDGFVTLGARKLTVPAGGKASVDVTVDTRLGGTLDGTYTASVVATGGDQSVRTNAAVEREIESYDLTLKYLDRSGRPASVAKTGAVLVGMGGLALGHYTYPAPDESGTAKVRVPKGTYTLDSAIYEDPRDPSKGGDWLVQPKLEVAKDTTVTTDARITKPAVVTVPDTGAKPTAAGSFYVYRSDEAEFGTDFWAGSFKEFRSAHMGPQVTEGLSQQWIGRWVKGASTEYHTVSGGKVKKLATGYTKHVTADQFATVKVGLGASAPGKTGHLLATGFLPSVGPGVGVLPERRRIPSERTLLLSAADQASWSLQQLQYRAEDTGPEAQHESIYTLRNPQVFKAGRTYRETFNTGVVGPTVGNGYGLFRDGDSLALNLPTYTDGYGHPGASAYSSARTTLYRNGVKIADDRDADEGGGEFKVPSADAKYQLTTSVRRGAGIAAISTRIDASWTFRSGTTREFTELPLSTARFRPALALDSTAPAGRTQSVPVTVEGAAAGGNLRSLTVEASYDQGRTWKKVTVRGGRVAVKNPAKGKGVALRATITDRKGTVSTVSVYNAYHGR